MVNLTISTKFPPKVEFILLDSLKHNLTTILEVMQGKDVFRKHNAFLKLGYKNIGGTYIING